MMAVLGVDPSLTKTGLALIDHNRLGILTCRVATGPSAPTVRGKLERLRYIRREVLAFAPEECLTVIEAPILAHGNASGALFDRAGLYWLLIDELSLRGPVVAVAPPTRAVYACGKGNGTKAEVYAAMSARPPHLSIADHNVADALALAAMGARHLGRPIDGPLPPDVLRAMDIPIWPEADVLRAYQYPDLKEAIS